MIESRVIITNVTCKVFSSVILADSHGGWHMLDLDPNFMGTLQLLD